MKQSADPAVGSSAGEARRPSNCFVRLLPAPLPPPNKTNVVLFCVVQKQRFVIVLPLSQPMFFSFVQFSVLYSLETTAECSVPGPPGPKPCPPPFVHKNAPCLGL